MRKLSVLGQKYPDDPEIKMVYGNFHKRNNENLQAKEYYEQILMLNPHHIPAKRALEELQIVEKGLLLDSIEVKGNPKTRLGSVLRKIQTFRGKAYSQETKEKITGHLESLPSISAVRMEYIESERGKVDLFIELDEVNYKIYGFHAGGALRGAMDQSLGGDGYPAVLYRDMNYWRTGNQLMVVFAGVYLGLDYLIPERKGLPVDMNLHGEVLIYPVPTVFYSHGKTAPWELVSPYANIGIEIEKKTPFFLEMSTAHKLRMNRYEGTKSQIEAPAEVFTYTGDFSLAISTQDINMPGMFITNPGVTFEVTPSISYKPGYEPWGLKPALFEHNDFPGFSAETAFSYYKELTKRFSWGLKMAHLGSYNQYYLEQWAVGQTNLVFQGPRLSGYLPKEFRTEGAGLVNLDARLTLVKDKSLIYGKHDFFYDMEEDILRQGSSLGLAFRLPYQVEFFLESNIGWNAERANGLGWNIQLGLSRYFSL